MNDQGVLIEGLWGRIAQAARRPLWIRRAIIHELTEQIWDARDHQ